MGLLEQLVNPVLSGLPGPFLAEDQLEALEPHPLEALEAGHDLNR